MEKIDTFTITGLTVEGFKCFAERRRFDLGGMTTIIGHNGQGKSSVAEAIAYAVTGSPYYGEQNLDRLYALGGKNVFVELNFEDGCGAAHTLTRSRQNDVTTITYDGVAVRQSDLTAMFGEKDVFLSIFNPLYFIEVLGDKGRNLLERYLPAVPHESVLARLGESYRALLGKQTMKSPESLLEKVRADIKGLEDAAIYAEGQRDLLESQARDNIETARNKSAEIGALDVKIADLEKKRAEGLSFDDMRSQLDDLFARCDELTHEGGAMPPGTSETDAAIQEAVAELEKRRAGEYVSQYAAQIAETEAAVAQLREGYIRETSILAGLAPGIHCPMCKQEVTQQNIAAVKKSFADSIEGIREKGNALVSKLNELKELDEISKSVFEDFRNDDVKKLEAGLEGLKLRRAGIIAGAGAESANRKSSLDTLKGQIQTLELDLRFGNLAPDEGWTLEELKEDRAKLESELGILNSAKPGAGADEKSADIGSIKAAIKEKRGLEDAVKAYISERVRLILEGLGPLNRIDIVLFEAVKKTGAVRDVFKFSYDGKPYMFLSLSEKIKAGLEVSELIKRLTGRNYPVFIDNGESVPVIDNVKPSGQVIVAQVVKGAALKAEILGGIPAGLRKAA